MMAVSENLIIDSGGAQNGDGFDLFCPSAATESQTNYNSPVKQMRNFSVLLLLLSDSSFPSCEVVKDWNSS